MARFKVARSLRRFAALALALASVQGLARAADDAGKLFAGGDFDAAAAAYTAALAQNPNDAAANLGLSRIELYRNHLSASESLFRKALSDAATAPAAQRGLATIATRRGTAGQYRVEPVGYGKATVPFVQTDPLPIVRVRIGARQSYFLIDTGAPDIALDGTFAQELKLKTKSTGLGVFAGGQRAKTRSTLLPQLTIGGLKIRNVPAAVLPTRNFGGKYRIDGVIGTGFLARFVSTLDYLHGSLILRSQQAWAAEQAALPSGTAVVPMWLVGDHFIFARGRINDAPEALFNIDTGLAGGGVQATKAEVAAAHIVLDEAHAGTGMGGGGVVRFIPFRAVVSVDGASVTDVPGIYTPEGDQFGIFPFSVAGAISHGFFRRFSVTFDFSTMQMTIQQP